MFKGSMPALVTPFKDGAVDFETLKRLVDWHIDQGSHGLVPVGTTGESPTLTHGDMKYGAGVVAAKQCGAAGLVDPRPFAKGSIAETFDHYPDIGTLLPAMGYGDDQVRDLEDTINSADCEAVVIGTPIDLRRIVDIKHPSTRVTYELEEIGEHTLDDILSGFIS